MKNRSIIKNVWARRKTEPLKNEMDRLGICVEYYLHMGGSKKSAEEEFKKIQSTILNCISRLNHPLTKK
jgi:hypothetical protein